MADDLKPFDREMAEGAGAVIDAALAAAREHVPVATPGLLSMNASLLLALALVGCASHVHDAVWMAVMDGMAEKPGSPRRVLEAARQVAKEFQGR